MKFPIRNKAWKSLITAIILLVIATGYPIVAIVAWLSQGEVRLLIPGAVALCLGGYFGLHALWYAIPLSLDLVGENLELRRRGRLEGRIPLKIIDRTSTQYAQHKGEMVPEGIQFKLFDNNDPDTLWPGFTSPTGQYELTLLETNWDRSLNQVLNDLRDAQITYMRANHLLPPEDTEENPFDFG